MPTSTSEIRPFNLRAASSGEYAALNAFKNILRREILPDDPPWPLTEDVHRWQTMPTMVEVAAWAAWDDSGQQVLAFGQADIFHTGDNPQLVEVRLEVLPDFRRQGLGTRLLRLVADHTRKHARNLLLMECNDRAPAGAEFLARLGARKGLDEPVNQLDLAHLDRDLVKRWLAGEDDFAAEFSLGLWDCPYPDERLQDLADLMQVVGNDQPRDTLEMEDNNYSPDLVRQFDDSQRAGGDQRWSMYLISRKDNRLAGISEVFWNPNRPAILWQGFTGVMPEYRNRGLGRWLKAAMLTKVLRERPQVQVIRAGNASSNAPMLKINRALGFKQLVAWSLWQVHLDSVEQYLAARDGSLIELPRTPE